MNYGLARTTNVFTLHAYDPCNSTALFENQAIEQPIELRMRQPKLSLSLQGFTDKISDESGIVDDCGQISYRLARTDPGFEKEEDVPDVIQLLDDY